MPANKKIQHALDAIIAIITANYSSGANAIRLRTAKPPNKISVFPAAIAWVGNGKWTKDDATTKRGLHTLKLIIAVAAKGDFQREVTTLMNYSDDLPDKLLGDVALSGNVDTIIEIRYEFGDVPWGDQMLIGWLFQIDVKMKSPIA